ncbi:MAG TPA: hypothetical protein VJM11_17595, partial [Nevskiaceae bacterium]|nr:hypothetical protein [Nevskiaceae bacterium]
MSPATTIPALPALDWTSPKTWGIGAVRGPGLTLPYPVSYRDLHHDTTVAAELLGRMGLSRGGLLLMIAGGAEWAQTAAYERACTRLGAVWAPAMPLPHDAYRVEMFLRRFAFQAVFGITPWILDGLEAEQHDLAKVFGGVPTLIARPGAWERLRAAGLSPWRLHALGPLLAFEPPGESALLYDASDWAVEAQGGQLVVTSRASRACAVVRLPTGVKGSVDGGRVVV